jgi:hypothetical protein
MLGCIDEWPHHVVHGGFIAVLAKRGCCADAHGICKTEEEGFVKVRDGLKPSNAGESL